MRRFFNNRFEDSKGGNDEGGFDREDNMPDGGFDEDDFAFDNSTDSPVGPLVMNNKRPRYSDAYGDYMGGYGPGGGFGPRPLMHGPPPRMPPPLMGPMRPLGPPGPPRPWMRHYGPGRPSRRNFEDDKAIRYLTRCGVSKEHLKNLPHDLLMLIQPEHCGLCDMPFKARDLYCELCDVQITSKMHGDAHYEGKPHRGIVEGRKKPKNPILLQSNMQQRLEQLIRREKRFLKPAKDAADGEEGAAKDGKPTPSPELYCNICKTTVTCSEQMTMHLNGKRHLSKEKQHILSMMSGKDENEDEENKDDEEKGEGGEDEAQPEGAAKEAGDDDWGNESWDNQDEPQTAA